jgi:response regulator of citrate/malate metabolism
MNKLNKIMLIDDDNVSNFINEQLIRKLEIAEDIIIATNGQEAMAHVSETQVYPELIFLDINMPVANGFEFLKNLKIMKLVNAELIIVILTNQVNPGDLERLIYFGISEIINKPLTQEKLQWILKKYFKQ